MGGGGGGTASADNQITFNDSSEYMFRNSSTKRGGFEGNVALTTTNTDLDTRGTEDIIRVTDNLNDADRDKIRDQLQEIVDCVGPDFCADKQDLSDRADVAWDRALTLFDDTKGEILEEVEDLKQEAIDRICLRRNQWARTAGSSLNCLVQDLERKAEVELTRRLAGVVAEKMPQLRAYETQAINEAFRMHFYAKGEMPKIAFSHIGNLWNILRGAKVTDTTDRDYTEDRDEDVTNLQLAGKFYHEQTDISDNDGTYTSIGDDAISTSQGASSILFGLIPV